MEKVVRKKRRRLSIITLIIIFIILSIIISTFVFLFSMVMGRLNKIKKVEIDKTDLEINTNIEEEAKEIVENKEIEFNDIMTIALFGSDSRDVDNMAYGRADTIIIASINMKEKSIKLISIPRDTYVYIPASSTSWWDGGKDKINHAYAYGGEQLLIKTLNNNFGLAITEFATIDFIGLANVINSIGGIELEITEAERDIINKYLYEIYELEGKQYKALEQYGKITLNGEQAVAHCRDRYVGTDFTRQRRQRDVITATINKVSKLSIDKVMNVIDTILEQISTNIDVVANLGKITSIITNIKKYKENITSVQVPTEEYGSGQMIDGVYYFVADLDISKQKFIKYIYGK